jgi:hypothetical protein
MMMVDTSCIANVTSVLYYRAILPWSSNDHFSTTIAVVVAVVVAVAAGDSDEDSETRAKESSWVTPEERVVVVVEVW